MLKFFGLLGITANAASATSFESTPSKPYCFDAIAGFRASASVEGVRGDGKRDVDNADICWSGDDDDICQGYVRTF